MPDNDNSNVIILPVNTTLDLPLDDVLGGALQAAIQDAVVVGYLPDSSKIYFASTTADMAEVLLILERVKAVIIRVLEGREN
jgi:hypothetical protein